MTRILLVDDSPATRAFVRAALVGAARQLGPVLVVEAGGGFEALRLLPDGPYDLVICDIYMPDINGLELLRFIRSNGRHALTPVVLISTEGTGTDRRRGAQLGSDAFVQKPFTPAQIVEVVASLLSERRVARSC